MSTRFAARAVAATGLIALLPGSTIGPDSAGLHVRAQTPATPTASMTGTIAGDAGASVTGVSVLLFPSTAPDRSGLDAALRLRRVAPAAAGFEIRDVPAGAYRLAVADDAALAGWPGEPTLARLEPAAMPVTVAPGDQIVIDAVLAPGAGIRRIANARMMRTTLQSVRSDGAPGALPRGRAPLATGPARAPAGTASISGVVTGDDGPLTGAMVAAVMPRGGDYPSFGRAMTDERGAYIITGLRAGSYLIAVLGAGTGSGMLRGSATPAALQPITLAGGVEMAFATTYYPAAPHPSAAGPVTIADGQALAGVDVALRRRTATTVTGRIITSEPTARDAIFLVPLDRADQVGGLNARMTTLAAGGSFSFAGVPHGDYLLNFANRQGWTRRTVRVGIDVTKDMAVTLARLFTVSGRVDFAGSARSGPHTSPVTVTLRQAGMRPGNQMLRQTVGADGTFSIPFVPGDEYLLQATTERPWVQVSGLIAGQDSLDAALAVSSDVTDAVVVLADRESAVTATVTDQDGQPAVGGAVLIFAADESQWNAPRRTRLTPLASSGRAVMTGLPPGDYVAIARPDLAPNRPVTPALIRALRPSALPFTLTAGEQKAIQLLSQRR